MRRRGALGGFAEDVCRLGPASPELGDEELPALGACGEELEDACMGDPARLLDMEVRRPMSVELLAGLAIFASANAESTLREVAKSTMSKGRTQESGSNVVVVEQRGAIPSSARRLASASEFACAVPRIGKVGAVLLDALMQRCEGTQWARPSRRAARSRRKS